MKKEMKESLERRFGNAEKNDKLLIATLLDPRFSKPQVTEQAKSLVRDKVSSISTATSEDVDASKHPCSGVWFLTILKNLVLVLAIQMNCTHICVSL